MNWSQLFSETKGKLPYERSNRAVHKLQPYLDMVKEKYAQVAKDFGQSFREFGVEAMGSATVPSLDQRVSEEAEQAKGQRGKALVIEDMDEESRPAPRTSKREATILIQYQIQVDQLEGEVAIPQGTNEADMKRMILEDCAFHLTTNKKEAGEKRKSEVLTGFNSFASLFSRF